MPTAKQELLEIRFPDVAAFVAAQIEAGQSWRYVRDYIRTHHGVTVSHESLRQWYGVRSDAA